MTVTASALYLGFFLDPAFNRHPFFFLYPAGFFSVWFGGVTAGILSVLLGCGFALYWKVIPSTEFWELPLFVIFGTLFGLLIGREKSSRRREYKTLEELRIANQEVLESKKKLGIAIRARDDFFSMASHELKTPVTALKLQLQLLQRQVSGKSANTPGFSFQTAVKSIDSQITRLTRLVESLLDITRSARGALELRLSDCELRDLVQSVVDEYSPMLKSAGCTVELEQEGSTRIQCDSFRLEQVFINLISNATKYAPGSPIRIAFRNETSALKIVFSDNGPGMSVSDQEHIFAAFHRNSETEKTVTGLGLGLFIVKQVVQAHGGTIECFSQQGKGTSFSMSFPTCGSEAAQSLRSIAPRYAVTFAD